MSKEFLSAIAIVLTVYSYLPYAYSIYKDKTKPHIFSRFIWGVTTVIVSFAQLADDGGVGAWPLIVSGFLTLIVAILAYVRKSDKSATKSDWVFLIVAMMSLPFWYYTSDPLWAVVILTTIDVLGFGPTFRKAHDYPNEEQASFYGIFVIRNVIAMMALEHYSVTTTLFPITTGIACLLLVWVIVFRRRLVMG